MMNFDGTIVAIFVIVVMAPRVHAKHHGCRSQLSDKLVNAGLQTAQKYCIEAVDHHLSISFCKLQAVDHSLSSFCCRT